MYKKVVILSVACVLALATVCVGGAKLAEAKERIEHLRAMAQQAKERGEKEKAKEFMAEAEEIERAVKPELDGGERGMDAQKIHRKLAELKEAAVLAERQGQHEKADQLHKKAGILAGKIESRPEKSREYKFYEARERIEQLRAMAHQAEERGDREKVKQFLAELEEIERALKRESQHGQHAEEIEKIRREIAELTEAAELAERQGQHDKAAELRAKAEHLAKEIGKIPQHRKEQDIEREIKELYDRARQAKAAGNHEKAMAIMREAKELERHLKEMSEPEQRKEPAEDLRREVDRLCEEVMRLRTEVEELKEIVRNKIRRL